MATQIQLRRDTTGDWDSANPTLAAGEVGLIVDGSNNITGVKIGNGTTAFSALQMHLPIMGGVANSVDITAGTTNETFLLKGVNLQTAVVLGVEAKDSTDLLFSVAVDGTVKVGGGFGVTGLDITTEGNLKTDGSIEVGGGFGFSGLTVNDVGNLQTDGTIHSAFGKSVEVGTYSATESGVKLSTSGADNDKAAGHIQVSSEDDAEDDAKSIEVLKHDDGAGNATTTFSVAANGDVASQGSVTAVGDVNCATLDASGNVECVDVDATGDVSGGGVLSITGSGESNIHDTLDMNNERIRRVATPTTGTDAANQTYVDDAYGLRIGSAHFKLDVNDGDPSNLSGAVVTGICSGVSISGATVTVDFTDLGHDDYAVQFAMTPLVASSTNVDHVAFLRNDGSYSVGILKSDDKIRFKPHHPSGYKHFISITIIDIT